MIRQVVANWLAGRLEYSVHQQHRFALRLTNLIKELVCSSLGEFYNNAFNERLHTKNVVKSRWKASMASTTSRNVYTSMIRCIQINCDRATYHVELHMACVLFK